MKARVAFLVSSGVLVALTGSGCGGDDDARAVPTAEQLAAQLLAPDDLEGAWSVTVPDSDVEVLLCPKASDQARAAASGLEWDAFMQLELETGDSITPPADRTGHMIFLQQFLAATDPTDTAATFDLLRQGAEACLGEIDAGEEGPGYAEVMDVPDLGDDSYGVLMTVEEAGGWAEWRLHEIIVRDGPVLMLAVVTDIRAGDGVEPYFTIDAIGDIAQTALDKL